MKRDKIIYWVATIGLTLLMLMSAGMYIFNNAEITKVYTSLGYPTYIIYPLAIAKIAGLIVILTNKYAVLKEWVYAGFTYNFVLAFFAHQQVGDGQWGGALLALVLLAVSYFYSGKR